MNKFVKITLVTIVIFVGIPPLSIIGLLCAISFCAFLLFFPIIVIVAIIEGNLFSPKEIVAPPIPAPALIEA